ncbi:MAG TPA: TerC family protein [Bacteroidia bacterium]|nr:TerC family protein [Bacteroidia bacterium]
MHLEQDFIHLFSFGSLISLFTLSVLEIVLGIDNIIFISIIAGKLPANLQSKARSTGLMLALVMRIILLFGITWVISAKGALFHLLDVAPFFTLQLNPEIIDNILWSCSTRDLILLAGGIFLLYKSTVEIHNKIEGAEEDADSNMNKTTLTAAIFQIVVIDMVFSFDSILTAVGLVDNLLVMILAVVVAMTIMLLFSAKVSDFVNNNPTIKMLALSFLLMIGMILIADALHFHVPKGYIYFSMAFSLLVEMLNMRMQKKKLLRQKAIRNSEPHKAI